MARILTVLAVLGLAVSLAPAETVVGQWNCERDNFNVNYSPGETDWNAGLTWNWRYSKVQQEGTYYCDWSYDALEELEQLLAAGPADPNNWLEVRFGIYGTSGASATKVSQLQTLDSVTDWAEGQDNRGPSTGGAANDFAVGPAPGGTVPWVDAATQQPAVFWNLSSAFTNSVPMLGWKNGPEVANMNQVVLDPPLVMHLIGSQYNRGLRAFQMDWDGTENAGCAAIGQWDGGGKLLLVEVPEPATMLLLGVGGLGVLLRKKR